MNQIETLFCEFNNCSEASIENGHVWYKGPAGERWALDTWDSFISWLNDRGQAIIGAWDGDDGLEDTLIQLDTRVRLGCDGQPVTRTSQSSWMPLMSSLPSRRDSFQPSRSVTSPTATRPSWLPGGRHSLVWGNPSGSLGSRSLAPEHVHTSEDTALLLSQRN